MATYKYQQNVYEGASYGYVKYNIYPDFGSNVYVPAGTQITIEAEVFHKTVATKSFEIGITMPSLNTYKSIALNITIPKNTVKTFKVTFYMWQLNSSWSSSRVFNVNPFFVFNDAIDGLGSGQQTYWENYTTTQKIQYLAYSINPQIKEATFERYELDSSSYVKSDDGTYVYGKLLIRLAEGYTYSSISTARVYIKNENGVNLDIKYLSSSVLSSALSTNGYIENGPVICPVI